MLFDPTQDYPVIDCFPHQVNVLNKTTTVVNLDTTVTYTVAASKVPALVTRAGSRLRLIYAQRNIEISHRIYISKALTLTTGSIIQFETSRYFFIEGVQDVLESGQLFLLDCREIEGTQIIVEEE